MRAAARLLLIVALAAGLAGLTVIAAPAQAGDGGAPVRAALGTSPATDSIFTPDLVAPVGEELRGSDYGRDWQHCVQVVANLRAKHPKVPLVVLLGGSSARECTVLDDNWERQIKKRSGYVVDAYNLGSKHRSYAQDLAFVKLLPKGVPTIVYIGVNLGRFCLPPGSATITLPRARPLARYPQHVYHANRIQSWSTKQYYVRYWLSARYPEFRSYYSSELGVLQKIIRVCKQRHLRVALVDLPRDLPVIGSALNGPVSRYQDGCAALARRWSIPWLHFNGVGALRRPRLLRHLPPGRARTRQVPEHPLGQDHPAAEEVPHAQAAAAVAVAVAVAEHVPVALRLGLGGAGALTHPGPCRH